MKKNIFTTVVLIVTVLLSACSNDDNEPTVKTGNYFPSSVNNYWNYDVKTTDNDLNNTDNSEDFMSVELENNSVFELEANGGNTANGVLNKILVNGELERTDSKLMLNGGLSIPIKGFESLSIPLVDAILYDLNARDGSILSNFEGSLTQDLSGLPFTLEYELLFNKGNNQNSLKVKSTSYSNISSTNISLNLTISTTVTINNIETQLTVLETQDLMIVKAYFGEDVGLLKSDSSINFDLDAEAISVLKLAGVVLETPIHQSITCKEELSSFKIN